MSSRSRAIRSQSQRIVKFVKFEPLIFLNCKSYYGASIYDKKMDARTFKTIHNILRCLSLVQSLLEGRNAPIWQQREPTHMRLSKLAHFGLLEEIAQDCDTVECCG